MNDISDGELSFTNREELEAWLKPQPREVSVVIAARAALRILPLLHRFTKVNPRHFATLIFASFWASALARVAAKYPTRASDLRSAAAAYAAGRSAATAAYAPRAAHADYTLIVRVARAATTAADDVDFAADAARTVDFDASAVWAAVTADASRLLSVGPVVLAGEKLWPGGEPAWSQRARRDMQTALSEPHWRPWLDWYRRRLDGLEAPEEIEMLFATLPVDPREKDVAEQNAELARRIAELKKFSGDGEGSHEPKPLPNPVENISAPFDFGWNAAHRVAVVAGPQNTPIFPFAGSDRDHHDRLDACRKTVERLIADLAAQRFNARPDYRLVLETYLEELPAAPGSGNLLLADAEARVLRDCSRKTRIFWRARWPNGSIAFWRFTSRCGPSIRASAASMTM
ncbi:MAG: hypothetical protein WA156_10835 [Methylocystis silviterrae]